MRTQISKTVRSALFASAVSTLIACAGASVEKEDLDVADDVEDALDDLPEAEVLHRTFDGLPTYIVGELGKAGDMQTDDAMIADQMMRPALAPALKAFRLTDADIALRHMNVDADGGRHFRYQQTFNGLDVIGGDLVVHVDVKGAIQGINGNARGDISGALGSNPISQAVAHAQIFKDSRFAGLAVEATRHVYVTVDEGHTYKAYETIVSGTRSNGDPVRDRVYVDMDSGEVVAVHPTIHFAQNRQIYSGNNTSSLPGTLKRSEGQAATSDVDVNAAYDNSGATYTAYNIFWGRDSYDNAGAALKSTVHHSTNYCNAFWNGTQMVYGDGNASQNCFPLARSTDVAAHELTHAVTEYESGLVYSGESGGMNEALSDIFGAFVEAWVDGGKTGTNLVVSNDTWLVGEDILPPALRYMCDPAADGASHDAWTSSTNSVDVHYSSGVGNLAFCLLTKGGTHPRGKTTINVPSIGMEKAIRIFYKAQVDIMTSNMKYAQIRTATEQAATALGYDQATKDAVSCAWAAVKVGTAPTS